MHNWDWEMVASVINFFIPVLISVGGLWAYEIYSDNALAKENKTDREAREAKKKKGKRQFKCLLYGLLGLCAAGLFAQIMAYRQKHSSEAYDTEAAKRFQSEFNGDFMVKQRLKAALAISEYRSSTNRSWEALTNSTHPLDYVLGFFDTIGYDVEHGKISPDVVHEYFYDDLRGYCQSAEAYIVYDQTNDSPEDFKYVRPMLGALTEIEAAKLKQTTNAMIWKDEDISEYLRSEIELRSDVR